MLYFYGYYAFFNSFSLSTVFRSIAPLYCYRNIIYKSIKMITCNQIIKLHIWFGSIVCTISILQISARFQLPAATVVKHKSIQTEHRYAMCWINVGPTSGALAQHWTSIKPMSSDLASCQCSTIRWTMLIWHQSCTEGFTKLCSNCLRDNLIK